MLRAVLFDLDGTLMDHDAARAVGLRAHLNVWLPDVLHGVPSMTCSQH
jgi:FMN phosphatase YigB (HAD superfamily)